MSIGPAIKTQKPTGSVAACTTTMTVRYAGWDASQSIVLTTAAEMNNQLRG